MLRYENIAALKYHQQRGRELKGRIAAVTPSEAAAFARASRAVAPRGLWGEVLFAALTELLHISITIEI